MEYKKAGIITSTTPRHSPSMTYGSQFESLNFSQQEDGNGKYSVDKLYIS